jgi:hypothetical protein
VGEGVCNGKPPGDDIYSIKFWNSGGRIPAHKPDRLLSPLPTIWHFNSKKIISEPSLIKNCW